MSGQHVGGLSDAIKGDEGGSAKAQRDAMKALVRPQAARGTRFDIGDGDVCPVVAEHGKMFAIKETQRQYCTHQMHDGEWSKLEKQPSTPAFWPLGHASFEAAVARYQANG